MTISPSGSTRPNITRQIPCPKCTSFVQLRRSAWRSNPPSSRAPLCLCPQFPSQTPVVKSHLMATSTSSDDSPPSSPPLPPSSYHSLLPPYPEMILEAIAALGEENGSSQAAIARRIEATHGATGELPPSHPALVAAHLSRMAAAGSLVSVAGGKYMLAFTSSSDNTTALPAPPPPTLKRGRGRPPKSRSPLPPTDASNIAAAVVPNAAPAAPRRRGRPPKPRDPHALPKIPRPRGRPRKNPVGPNGVPLPRVPPSKVRPQFAEVGFV